jgi:hypothetical protein
MHVSIMLLLSIKQPYRFIPVVFVVLVNGVAHAVAFSSVFKFEMVSDVNGAPELVKQLLKAGFLATMVL